MPPEYTETAPTGLVAAAVMKMAVMTACIAKVR